MSQSLPPTPALWPDPDHGPWHITLHWTLIDGRAECTGLEIRSDRFVNEPHGSQWANPEQWHARPRALTTSVLRGFPLGKIVDETKRSVARWLGSWPDLEPDRQRELRARARQYIASTRKGRKGGRPPEYGPDHWAKVAATYADAYRLGGKPTDEVARTFRVSRSTASNWVARCRQMGLLTPTSQGRPGGIPPADDEGSKS